MVGDGGVGTVFLKFMLGICLWIVRVWCVMIVFCFKSFNLLINIIERIVNFMKSLLLVEESIFE
mgnify:CR=1 FL=1